MIPYLYETTIETISDMAQHADDPLRLREHADRNHDEQVVLDALRGVDADTAARVAVSLRRLMAGKGALPTDRLFCELIRHHDMDPLIAVWLAVANGAVDIVNNDDMVTGISFQSSKDLETGQADDTIWIRGDVLWQRGGRMSIYDIPDTLAAAMPGRRLDEIVSHPVLDRYGLTVRGVATFGARTTLTTDHARPPVSIDDLVGMMRRQNAADAD